MAGGADSVEMMIFFIMAADIAQAGGRRNGKAGPVDAPGFGCRKNA
jgi:hypothetical protein